LNATPFSAQTASLFNLAGPDLIIILMILVFLAAAVIGLVVIVMSLNRRKPTQPPPPLPTPASVTDRLQQLEHLKQQNLISDSEYEEQRRRIISGV
jgi:hypothetical protein